MRSYQYCFVPLCGNTTLSTPHKVFLFVPVKEEIRKEWCKAAGIPGKKLRKVSSCCEDHFDLQNDLKNPSSLKTGGRKFLKDGVVPRFFKYHNRRQLLKQPTPQTQSTSILYELLSEGKLANGKTIKTSTQEKHYNILHEPVVISDRIDTFTQQDDDGWEKLHQSNVINKRDAQIQANLRPTYRSKSTSCNIGRDLKLLKDVGTQCDFTNELTLKRISNRKTKNYSLPSSHRNISSCPTKTSHSYSGKTYVRKKLRQSKIDAIVQISN